MTSEVEEGRDKNDNDNEDEDNNEDEDKNSRPFCPPETGATSAKRGGGG